MINQLTRAQKEGGRGKLPPAHFRLSVLVLTVAFVSLDKPVFAQYATAKDITIEPNVFIAPAPVVYGQGANAFGSGTLQQVVRTGLPLAQSVISGGLGGAVPGALSIAQGFLPENLQQYAGILTPLLSGALSGGGVNLGGLVSSGLPLLTNALGLSGQNAAILSSLTPALKDLLGGHVNMGGLLSTGIGLAGQLLGGNSPFGAVGGILGGLFGGGGSTGTGVEIASDLSQIYSNPITGAINSQIFDSSGGSANTVLSQTGSALCLYNPDCVQSNPAQYKSLYSSAVGPMGFSSSNQVRGQIAYLSGQGVMPDAFSSKLVPQQNAYYMGNLADREISRASTEQYLSKAGQLAQKRAIEASHKTAQALAALGDKCDKESHSSQELIRCNMKINTAGPSFQAAQLELSTNQSNDNQFMKNSLGNISASADALNRQQDIERSSWSAQLKQNLALTMPISGKK